MFINREYPVIYTSSYGNHEVGDGTVFFPLCQCQDISQFGIAQFTLTYIASVEMV